MNTGLDKRFIKELKSGRAPGPDGITAEHLKFAGNSILPLLLSQLGAELLPSIWSHSPEPH